MRPRAVALLALALWGGAAVARADEPLRYGVRLEAGAEHDSNPARVETLEGLTPPTIVASAVGRFVAAGHLTALLGPRQALSLSAGLAGKRFLETSARAEDVLITEGRASYGLSVGDSTAFDLSGSYYDVFQRGELVSEARDFRSVAPAARVEQRLGPARLFAGYGHRWFVFKPQRDFDFSGATPFVGYRQALLSATGEDSADWEWGLSASLDLRRFRSARCRDLADCPPAAPAEARRDRFLVASADVSRTGDVLLGLGAAVHLNDSNSYGESLTRLLGHLRGVFLLPWQLSLSARAELVQTLYRDRVPVGHDAITGMLVDIEDENRSTLRLELARPFGSLAEAGLRYTFYTNALKPGRVGFDRHTLLLYLAFVLER